VPRLLLTENSSDNYIALSHCWGHPNLCAPPLTTETIAITRKLGLRYVWIDSLCIIQDSPSDWEQEAARMADVYKGSYITIAATSAISSHDGFLKRPARTQPLAKVPYLHKDSGKLEGHFNLRLTDAHWAENSFDKHIEESVWNQRGWTFQERLLPKRVLHFAKDAFCLECRTRDYTEFNQPGTASGNRTTWFENDGHRLLRELPKQDRLYLRWYALVERYCLRDFTYAKDKLAAIAGLAQEMAGFVDDVYLGGLWKNDLCRGLMWDTVDMDDDYTRIKAHSDRAPSWSWAHFDGRITWASASANYQCILFTLLDYKTTQIADQVAGTCGWIKVSGKLMDVSAALLKQPSVGYVSTHNIILKDLKIGEGTLDLKDTSYAKPGLRAFLVHEVAASHGLNSYTYPQGLLLERTQKCSDEYRRVGTFAFDQFFSEAAGTIDLFDHRPTEIFTIV
jgi:hypothetical protein